MLNLLSKDWIPEMEMETLILMAKQGDQSAIEELRQKKIKIWTYKELKALNVFRQNRDSILNSEKIRIIWASPLRRDFYSTPEMAYCIYAQRINDEYKLLKVSFEDQSEQYWIIYADDGSPICSCTEWITKEEDHGRTKKQIDRLERQKKGREFRNRNKPGEALPFQSKPLSQEFGKTN